MSCVNGQMNECTERKLGQGLLGQVSRSWVLLQCVSSVCVCVCVVGFLWVCGLSGQVSRSWVLLLCVSPVCVCVVGFFVSVWLVRACQL